MKIVLAADHGGFELKEKIKHFLLLKNYDVQDIGTYSDSSVDYPDYGFKAGEMVVSGKADSGVIICGSGIGISIAANKIKGIRAALCSSPDLAKLSREHNNANILALGGRFLKEDEALKIVDVFLTTEFAGGRHQKRIDKITEYEKC